MSFARRRRREERRKPQTGECKFCGAPLAFLPATRGDMMRVYHAAPPCADFIRTAESKGGKLLPETMSGDEITSELMKEQS